MNYDQVIDEFKTALATPSSKLRTYSPSHIFDENKSVRWNKEEVERQNFITKVDREKCRTERFNAINTAKEHIIDYLCSECCSISKSKIAALFSYFYDNFYSNDSDFSIDCVIDSCLELLEIFSREDT